MQTEPSSEAYHFLADGKPVAKDGNLAKVIVFYTSVHHSGHSGGIHGAKSHNFSMIHFYLIREEWFKNEVIPALTSSWRRRNFAPITELGRKLAAFSGNDPPQSYDSRTQPISQPGVETTGFCPDWWELRVAEALLASVSKLPEIETPLESWSRLLRQELADRRELFSPIQQAVLGNRDLFLSRYYRPENAGWNDRDDVCRLAAWLGTVDPNSWVADDLNHLSLEDRGEELAYAQEWFPLLAEMYEGAEKDGFVILCERI